VPTARASTYCYTHACTYGTCSGRMCTAEIFSTVFAHGVGAVGPEGSNGDTVTSVWRKAAVAHISVCKYPKQIANTSRYAFNTVLRPFSSVYYILVPVMRLVRLQRVLTALAPKGKRLSTYPACALTGTVHCNFQRRRDDISVLLVL
jgi:hypothetical protein